MQNQNYLLGTMVILHKTIVSLKCSIFIIFDHVWMMTLCNSLGLQDTIWIIFQIMCLWVFIDCLDSRTAEIINISGM